MHKKTLLSIRSDRFLFVVFFLIAFCTFLSGQTDSNTVLIFDFNDHRIAEKNNRISPKPVGVSLTYDRFGNENSALYIHGHSNSYLNLGTSNLLKPKKGTISLWVKLERRSHAGKGYDNNPIIFTRNSEREDFHSAYVLSYEGRNNRFGGCASFDSISEAAIYSVDSIILNNWNHLVISFDDKHFSFYVNGKKQGECAKPFTTNYLESDSVVMGIIYNRKNERYSVGVFDDIHIYHRVLSENEIGDLYHAPDPNRWKTIRNTIFQLITIALLIILTSWLLVAKRRSRLKKEEENFRQLSRMTELEIRALRAQMNPHFVANCLVAIQNLITDNNNTRASHYLQRFSSFLRLVLKYSDEDYISIREEAEMIELYVELEQLRFEQTFDFNLVLDPAIDHEDAVVPSLITQPFIENAIWHGLLPLNGERKGRLTVQFDKQSDKTITITIEDNGVGRDPQRSSGGSGKGSQMIADRVDAINRIAGNSRNSVNVIDIRNGENQPCGTRIIIQLEN